MYSSESRKTDGQRRQRTLSYNTPSQKRINKLSYRGNLTTRQRSVSESNADYKEHVKPGMESKPAFVVDKDTIEDSRGYVNMIPNTNKESIQPPDSKIQEPSGRLHSIQRQRSHSESDLDGIYETQARNEKNVRFVVDNDDNEDGTDYVRMRPINKQALKLSKSWPSSEEINRSSNARHYLDRHGIHSESDADSRQQFEERKESIAAFEVENDNGTGASDYMCMEPIGHKQTTKLHNQWPSDVRPYLNRQRSQSESDEDFIDRIETANEQNTPYEVESTGYVCMQSNIDEADIVSETTALPDKTPVPCKRHCLYRQRSRSESDLDSVENKDTWDDPNVLASDRERVSSFPDNFEAANRTDTAGESDASTVSDTQNARQRNDTSPNNTGRSEKRIYLPNIHTKLLKVLLSSPDHRQNLMKDMARKGFDIVWPETEEGILYLEPSDSAVSSDGSNIHESVITPFFYSRLRHYFILDDSICVAEEIYDDLTALLAVAPLVTTCTLYIENMTWVIIGDKRSVEECKTQLKTLIKFLEMRMRAKGINTITKTMFLDKYADLVLEGKLFDRKYFEKQGVKVNVDSEHVTFGGEKETVESVVEDLQSFLQKIEASVYKCSPLVLKLLGNTNVKNSLRKLLKGRGLVSTWKMVDGICIVYGTSPKNVQSVMGILKRNLVSEVIKLTDGQTELIHSEIGRAEIEYAAKRYGGFLIVDTSDKLLEIICTMEIQAEVRKLFNEFLNRHEVIKAIHEVDIGLLKLLRKHHHDKLADVQRRCKSMNVEVIPSQEKSKSGFLLTGRRESCLEATRELEKILATITKLEFTIKKRVGHVSFLQSKEGHSQIATFESKHHCIVYFANERPHSQNSESQTTGWVFKYDNTELMVLHEDIRTVTTGLAYIPCLSAADQIKSMTDVEIPYQLEAGECMTHLISGQKQAKRYNFFACLPYTEPFASASSDVVKTSVNLCLQETTARGISAVAFSISNPIEPIYPAEYAEILLETTRAFLTTEKSKTMLKRVLFCTKDDVHAKQFTQDLRCVFGETAVRASASDIMKDICLSETDANGSEIHTEQYGNEADKYKRDTLDGSEKKDDISTVKTSYLRRKRPNDKDTPKGDVDGSSITETSVTDTKATYRLSSFELSVNVEVLLGDITKEATDVIVNSVHWNLDLSATVLGKAVLKEGGSKIQTELKTKGNQTTIRRVGIDGIVVTGPGKLNCKNIFHVLLQGSVNGWKRVISSCLQLAEKLRVTSVAFPALGTGRNGIKAQDFTKAILKCIKTFSTTNPTCLRDIRIVVFDEAMLNTVIQSANSLKDRKTQVYDVVQSPTQEEDEVRLQVYTAVDNVDCVKRHLAELCNVAVPELIDFYETLSAET